LLCQPDESSVTCGISAVAFQDSFFFKELSGILAERFYISFAFYAIRHLDDFLSAPTLAVASTLRG